MSTPDHQSRSAATNRAKTRAPNRCHQRRPRVALALHSALSSSAEARLARCDARMVVSSAPSEPLSATHRLARYLVVSRRRHQAPELKKGAKNTRVRRAKQQLTSSKGWSLPRRASRRLWYRVAHTPWSLCPRKGVGNTPVDGLPGLRLVFNVVGSAVRRPGRYLNLNAIVQ
jgi:hypothetical protein